MISVLQFAENVSSGQDASRWGCVRIACCRCNRLGLLHSVRRDSCGLSRLPCGMVHLRISNHVVTEARGVTHAEVEASQSASRRKRAACFPSWQHACQSRDAVLRLCSVGLQMLVRVHVN
ncbi:hypothetical protein TcCL_ESM09096 [Trypanosoma cruzi]|nr:hypothetical protein TcCL_ESM09096 [Trypanosoma cruzi]